MRGLRSLCLARRLAFAQIIAQRGGKALGTLGIGSGHLIAAIDASPLTRPDALSIGPPLAHEMMLL